MKNIPAVSTNGTHYDSYEDLLAAESNGYLATLILREKAPRGALFTYSTGPWPTQKEAQSARTKMRNRFRRQEKRLGVGSELVTTRVHPAWKEVS